MVSNQDQNNGGDKHRQPAINATEISGLLVIAFLIFVFVVVRYWHAIRWGWR